MTTIPQEWIDARCQPAWNILLHEYKAIYVSIPKAACTSLKTVLADLLGLEGSVHFAARFPQVPKEDIKRKFPDYFVFTFVRNPWDRVLSCFLSKITTPGDDGPGWRNGVEFSFWKYGDVFYGGMSFSEFVKAIASIRDDQADIHFASQYLHVTDSSGRLLADCVGRFESLCHDFAEVCARVGMPKLELPHLVKTEHGHYRTYYTPESRQLVRQRYTADVNLFGYEFEESP
jgi:hypothetical protein